MQKEIIELFRNCIFLASHSDTVCAINLIIQVKIREIHLWENKKIIDIDLFSGQSVRYSLCYQLIQMKIRVMHRSMEKHENKWRWLSWYFFVLISRLQGISGVANRMTIWEFGCLAFGRPPLKASTCLEKSTSPSDPTEVCTSQNKDSYMFICLCTTLNCPIII